MRIRGILETCLYVTDLDAAQQFYAGLLGLQVVERHPTRHLFLRCGDQMLLIFDADQSNTSTSSLPPHGAYGPGHVAFAAADTDVIEWTQRLRNDGIDIERTVEWPHGWSIGVLPGPGRQQRGNCEPPNMGVPAPISQSHHLQSHLAFEGRPDGPEMGI